MKNKYEVLTYFCSYKILVKNLFNNKIQIFQSDESVEFDNKFMLLHFSNSGVSFRKSCPDTPLQNNVAESKHKHIIKIVRTILIELELPSQFWVDTAFYVVYTINRHPLPFFMELPLKSYLGNLQIVLFLKYLDVSVSRICLLVFLISLPHILYNICL